MTGDNALDGLIGFGSTLFAGRAGLFLRVMLVSVVYVALAGALRNWLSPAGRAWGQIVASLVLLASIATPVIVALMALYAAVLFWLVEHAPAGRARATAVGAMLALQVIGPIFWLPALPGYVPIVREFVAFATNMTQLRAWAYAYDRLRLREPAQMSFRDYALYTFFLPHFVSGPILSPAEFLERRLPAYWDAAPGASFLGLLRTEHWALVRIGLGFATVALALHVIPILSPESYDAAARNGVARAWQQAIGVYFAIYLGFTAWSEAAIGFGRLAGVELLENFNGAHFSYGIADFWRRWNITLGLWMRKYVYVPLGGGHPHGWQGRVAWFNVSAVFVATAVYHHIGGLKLLGPGLLFSPAYYVPWLLWAAYNTVGTLATRRLRRPERWRARDALLVVFTFLFSAVALLTAFYPAGMPLAQLAAIYRQLLPF